MLELGKEKLDKRPSGASRARSVDHTNFDLHSLGSLGDFGEFWGKSFSPVFAETINSSSD